MLRIRFVIPLIMAAILTPVSVAVSLATPAQAHHAVPSTSNIEVREGVQPGEVIISWEGVPEATHYRIGYVNMEVDYHLAKASCTEEWIEAFAYVDVNARNIPIQNGRAEYTVRRLSPGARHAFTVLTSNDFVDTGGGGSVSSEFYWSSNPRWQFLPGRNTLPPGMTLPSPECTEPTASQTDPPPTSNIAVHDGNNSGELTISWDAVSEATHYRIGYVNMEVDYHLAKASCTGEWIEAFVYVDVNARNIPINNGRAEYTVRRLSPGARHAVTVLTSNNFVDTGSGGSVSSEFFWPSNPRWQFVPGRNTLPPGVMLPTGECTDVTQPTPSGSVEGDRATLVFLYDATDGDNWTNNRNWLSDSPVGQWYGVTTDAGGRVTELDLAENGLTGPIPPDLRNLTRLEELHLYRNSLTGPIPPELGALANLKQLYVDGNGLTGVLPQELVALTMLEELGFFSNPGLCAPTDSAMQRWLQGIDELYGSSCAAVDSAEDRAILVDFFDATGGANWTNNSNWLSDRPMREWHGVATDASGRVNGLLFRGNNLSGEILPSLGNLSKLEALAFHRNQLTGPIPSTLGSLSNLELLGLGGNQLTGPIPTTLGNLSKLELLYVYENELVGTIPPGLGNLTALEEVNLSRNQLQGRIPSELGGLTNLELLRLDRNQLDGPIPTQLGNLNNVEILSLGGNQLSGSIPSSFSGLVNLTELYLWGNELVGTVPGWLGNLTGLEKLELSDNRFDGPIPATLGNLINLDRLQLWGNELTGPVPAWLGSLTRLERLSLSNNQLTGEIPTTLGNLINLDRLHLWGNELTGPVPAWLGSLTRLERLGLSNNQLTGEIPTTLGNLTSLERLWLQNNQLTGTIPAELGNLTKLEIIKLAGNNLTGCIPQGLRAVADNDFDDLGLRFCSQSGASDVTVVSRDEEYSYSISVSDAWVEESEGRYSRTSPWSHLSITSLELGNSVTLAQHATWIRDSLKEEWWESASLFETTSFQKVQIDGQQLS